MTNTTNDLGIRNTSEDLNKTRLKWYGNFCNKPFNYPPLVRRDVDPFIILHTHRLNFATTVISTIAILISLISIGISISRYMQWI